MSTHDKQGHTIKFGYPLGKSASKAYALIQRAYFDEDRLASATILQWYHLRCNSTAHAIFLNSSFCFYFNIASCLTLLII